MSDAERAAAWRRDGYLMVRDALAPEYLDPIRAFIAERVDAFARERHAAGEIAALHEREPFGRRYAAIHEELSGSEQPRQPLFAAADLCCRALYDLYTHPALTEVLRVIVGPEVTLHGISVIRVKLPEDSQAAIPWHQDSHYYNEHKRGRFEANTEHLRVVTTWVPLVDSNLDNGCLWVIPGSHRWGFLSGARGASGHVLVPEDVERRGTPTPLPMRPGDVVFLTNLTLHASTVNRTDRVRWSHDFRYHPTAAATPPGTPEREATDYLDAKSRSYGTEPLCVLSAGPTPTWEEWERTSRARRDALARPA